MRMLYIHSVKLTLSQIIVVGYLYSSPPKVDWKMTFLADICRYLDLLPIEACDCIFLTFQAVQSKLLAKEKKRTVM